MGNPSKQHQGGGSTMSHSSSSTRWATHPNNIKEGGRPCLILPHQPDGQPIQTTSRRGVDHVSFFLINQMGNPSKQHQGGGSTMSHSSSSTRWATHPNNIKEGGRPCLILPHQPGGQPIQTTSRRRVDHVSFFLINQVGNPSKQHQGGGSTMSHSSSSTRWATHPNNIKEEGRPCLILPHQPGGQP